MDITHADENRNELRYLDLIERLDAQISIQPGAVLDDNSFQLQLPDEEWEKEPINQGHIIYNDGTEFGGIVEGIEHNTQTGIITLSGPTWRGLLMRKIISPPTGEAYYTITDEANAVISSVLGSSLSPMVTISDDNTGVSVSGSWRYRQAHEMLEKALEENGLTLDIKYDAALKTVKIGARAVVDYSAEIDLSQDYGIEMKSTQGRMDAYNHVIALGAGELTDRDILHVYRLDNGTITTDAPDWAGTVKDKIIIYDYSNPESIEELQKGAEKKLIEYAPLDGVQLDPSDVDIELPLGDIVGARDRLTGFSATARIIGKILTVNSDGYKIDTRVG